MYHTQCSTLMCTLDSHDGAGPLKNNCGIPNGFSSHFILGTGQPLDSGAGNVNIHHFKAAPLSWEVLVSPGWDKGEADVLELEDMPHALQDARQAKLNAVMRFS